MHGIIEPGTLYHTIRFRREVRKKPYSYCQRYFQNQHFSLLAQMHGLGMPQFFEQLIKSHFLGSFTTSLLIHSDILPHWLNKGPQILCVSAQIEIHCIRLKPVIVAQLITICVRSSLIIENIFFLSRAVFV